MRSENLQNNYCLSQKKPAGSLGTVVPKPPAGVVSVLPVNPTSYTGGTLNEEATTSCALFRQPVHGSDTPTKHLRHGHVVVIGHVLERPYDSHGEVDREFDDIPRKLVAHIRSFRRKFFVDGFINSFIILSFIC